MAESSLIVVRGGGDIATGTVCRLSRCGYKVLLLETAQPTAVRRTVAFSEAVYEGKKTVEGILAERIDDVSESRNCFAKGTVAVHIDPNGICLQNLCPLAVVDCILAKRNCGTHIDMSPLTIGVGPGFVAGRDVHVVIESMRGHNLGRLIYNGSAISNTGVPGDISGFTHERVYHAPTGGRLRTNVKIGDTVQAGDAIATVEGVTIRASIPGIVRGLLRDNVEVTKNRKVADIDPRLDGQANISTISDKARCISGGVLEAILSFERA